jgi:predicted SAM-dependent methyltransferase
MVKNARILHIAPEKRFSGLFEASDLYMRTDIDGSISTMPIDICTDMSRCSFKSESLDFVYASHVLEHIENVDDAIAEIHRILVVEGQALLDVPVYGKHTVKLLERDHDGHVWHPGSEDWFKRYEQAGFDVEHYPSEQVDPRYGVGCRSPVTLCKRRI